MIQPNLPGYIFETSWEVCHKVGGIYTVLASRAKTLQQRFPDKIVFIGPDLPESVSDFEEDKTLLPKWGKAAKAAGLAIRIGRWRVPGMPIAILVDFKPLFAERDAIFGAAWEAFGVDSMLSYGDYDEASMFSTAAGRVAECVISAGLIPAKSTIYQAHEWMSGLGMMFLKKAHPEVATIFTTHATSIGRSIAGNDKQLYEYFDGYNGDQMARELHMDAKHSVEKQAAHHADCFTTVSDFTARECRQLLDIAPDVVLPNGFENDFVPTGSTFTSRRRQARRKILGVASALTATALADDTLIVSTSGRNDFRCKGFDVFLEALAQLNNRYKASGVSTTKVLALIEVPCWLKGPREDLSERMAWGTKPGDAPLPNPYISHDLHNLNEDRIVGLIRALGLQNAAADPVKVILVPCYLDGHDGIFDMPYYDVLTANDLCIYPSYYEPWGYTPLESCAFKTPCITTDLSGFGQWVNTVLGHDGTLEDGVLVLHRDDRNYFNVAAATAEAIDALANMPASARTPIRRAAAKLADRAQWKHFVKFYYEAYAVALERAQA